MGNIKKLKTSKLGKILLWSVSDNRSFIYNDFYGDYSFLNYIDNLFLKKNKFEFIYSHVTLVNKFDKVILNVYLFDSKIEGLIQDYYYINSIFFKKIIRYISLVDKKNYLSNFNLLSFMKLASYEIILLEVCKRVFNKRGDINFYMLSYNMVTSNLLVNYVKIKLLQGLYLNSVLNKLKRYLSLLLKDGLISGYYIVCKGRYSKRSRGSLLKIKEGKLYLSNMDKNIEFFSDYAILKYGKVNISIWICKSNSSNSFHYKIKL